MGRYQSVQFCPNYSTIQFSTESWYENEIYSAFNRKEKNGRKIIVEESRPKEKTGKGRKEKAGTDAD